MKITNEQLKKLIEEKSKGGQKYKVMNIVERYHKYASDPNFEEKSIYDTKMYGDIHQFHQDLLDL